MEAVERSGHRTGVLSGAVASHAQEVSDLFRQRGEHMDQEGMGQGEQAKQLEAVFPAPHPHTLSAQVALAEAKGALDLPAPGVDAHHPAGILGGLDRLRR